MQRAECCDCGTIYYLHFCPYFIFCGFSGDGTTLAMSFPVWVSVFAHFVWRKNDDASSVNSQRLDLFGWICVLGGLLGMMYLITLFCI